MLLAAAVAVTGHEVRAQSGTAGARSFGAGGAGGSAGVRPEIAAKLVNGHGPIPANGSFLIDASGTELGAVELIDAVGSMINGKSRMLRDYVVWTPDHMLSAGEFYTLTIQPKSGSGESNTYTIEVADAWTPARPAVTASLELTRGQSPIPACCTMNGSTTYCFGSHVLATADLDIELTSTAPSSELTQVLFGFGVSELDVTPLVSRVVPFHEFGGVWSSNRALPRYCVTLQAIEIGSGDIYMYPDLMTRCVSHGELGEIGTLPANPSADQLAADRCAVPPVGYEARWCEANRECARADSRAECDAYGALCGPAVDAGVRDAGVLADAAVVDAGSSMDADAGAGRQPERDEASGDRERGGGGCNVRGASGGFPSVFAYVVGVIWAVTRIRSRARGRRSR